MVVIEGRSTNDVGIEEEMVEVAIGRRELGLKGI